MAIPTRISARTIKIEFASIVQRRAVASEQIIVNKKSQFFLLEISAMEPSAGPKQAIEKPEILIIQPHKDVPEILSKATEFMK